MNEIRNNEQCVLCDRPMKGSTRPCWVFDANYKHIGFAHAICSALHERGWRLKRAHYPEMPVARLLTWLIRHPAYGAGTSPRALARSLLFDASPDDLDSLNEQQEKRLTYWRNGSMGLSGEREQAVRVAYANTLTEYRAALPVEATK